MEYSKPYEGGDTPQEQVGIGPVFEYDAGYYHIVPTESSPEFRDVEEHYPDGGIPDEYLPQHTAGESDPISKLQGVFEAAVQATGLAETEQADGAQVFTAIDTLLSDLDARAQQATDPDEAQRLQSAARQVRVDAASSLPDGFGQGIRDSYPLTEFESLKVLADTFGVSPDIMDDIVRKELGMTSIEAQSGLGIKEGLMPSAAELIQERLDMRSDSTASQAADGPTGQEMDMGGDGNEGYYGAGGYYDDHGDLHLHAPLAGGCQWRTPREAYDDPAFQALSFDEQIEAAGYGFQKGDRTPISDGDTDRNGRVIGETYALGVKYRASWRPPKPSDEMEM
ncbi:MAG TPA: hypothetical protein VFT16_03695 [Candidatus Saccharimonadales bacterium]|nr:hypothetical protein [Candidatus Saccharimonadales bacterium]